MCEGEQTDPGVTHNRNESVDKEREKERGTGREKVRESDPAALER